MGESLLWKLEDLSSVPLNPCIKLGMVVYLIVPVLPEAS